MMELWVSFFSCRERELKLLQEELDRMDMSCLQGESWLGRGDAHGVGVLKPQHVPILCWGVLVTPECPQAMLGHVHHPTLSPSST